MNDHEENYKKLIEAAADEKTGCWRSDRCVAKEVTVFFHNLGVTLYPDGTYHLEDWSGG